MTTKRFRALIERKLEALGYSKVWGKTWGAVLLTYKRVDPYILCLGVETSRLYDSKFTASFYLSRSFKWGYMGKDFPRNAYERIGSFLDPAQRQALLEERYSQPGVVDAWWDWSREGDLDKFEETLKITEGRFLSQDGLLEALANSSSVARSEALVDATLAGLSEETDTSKEAELISALKEEAITVLKEMQPENANDKLAQVLADDAFRCLFHGVKKPTD